MNKKFFSNKYFWWGLGLLIVLIATSVEVFRGRNTNYFDYQDSTRMFWEGLSPYNLEYAQAHQIYFLYSPVFSVIFALPSNGYHNNLRNSSCISLYSCCQ